MARPDEEKPAVGTLSDASGESESDGGEFRRVQMEVVETGDFSDEDELAIGGVGGERMTVDEFGG